MNLRRRAMLREEMTWDKLRPLYVQIYQESFTQEEIDRPIAFYESPAGVAFVEKMPFVMQKSMSIMQSRMAPMMEKMKAAMKEALGLAQAHTLQENLCLTTSNSESATMQRAKRSSSRHSNRSA
jgi:hypothetical protein